VTRAARPAHAPPADLEAEKGFAEGMESDQLHCRELGHSWAGYTASWDSQAKVYDRTLVCSSCGCQRHQILDSEGYIVKNGGYHYPEGYLAKGVIGYVGGQVPRNIFRLAALQRTTTTAPRRRKRALKSVEAS
jgi:hypothetical protein